MSQKHHLNNYSLSVQQALTGNTATSTSLNGVADVAANAVGDLYLVDLANHRIRRVGTDGIISTVAGTGVRQFSGDGGPATNATLAVPTGIVVDEGNNLYIADSDNSRVRRVSASGIITTVTGGECRDPNIGGGCFSGDGGPAAEASLNVPSNVAVDAPGNVYIADTFNNRIRRVDLNGTISTVAGSGPPGGGAGFAGDGGPATGALLDSPIGISVDDTGNLYIADRDNHRVRKMGLDGRISTAAGNGCTSAALGDGCYSGDGGLASAASLNQPSDVAVDSLGNLYVVDSFNNRIRKVWAAAPGFVVSPVDLSFTAPSGAPVVAAQRIGVLSEALGLQWSATTTTESGGNWLTVTPSVGQAPGTIAVGVNVFALDPGTYRETVTVNAPLANPPVRTVDVTLTVEQALAPKLVAEPLTLTYETPTGVTSLPAKTLRISNSGAGTIEWSAQAETSSGGNWLELSPSSGSVSPGSPITAQVRVVPGSLDAGVYTGSIRVSSSTTGESEVIPVTLLIEQPTKTILVSQTGLIFTGVEGGAAVSSQTFGIANIGEGEMVWMVEPTTLSGGPNWLTVSPREGRSQAGSLRIPEVEVGVNAEGLTEGQYNGLLRGNAFGASNSPQFVTVTLDVLPPGSNPGVTVRPTGMIFAAQAGTFSPSSQNVRLSLVTPGQVEARSGLFTEDGGNWVEILPPNLVVSADDPRRVVVQPKVEGLAAGVYRAQLAYEFSDGSPTQRVEILFLVVPGPVGAGLSTLTQGRIHRRYVRDDTDGVRTMATGLEPAVDGCAPQRLHAVYRTITDNFRTPVSWPSPLEVLVADDCGGPATAAAVVASFSNGDPPLVLSSLGNGLYVGTWQPATVRDQVLVTVRAEQPPLQGTELRIQGQVGANPSVPAVSAGGIVNGASFAAGEPVPPGGIISLFGRNLAQGLNAATQLPLETSLGGATVNIGGIEAPLFFSSAGQINAQVPFELAPNTRPHVVVRTTREDGVQTLTLPETITVAAARPAIFTLNQAGTGQGAILNQDFSPNSATNAAERGSVVQIFVTGLGATDPVVASGQPAPGNPTALVTAAVEARIGGQPAAVQFAGLAPGFVGLYQVNVVVPPEVAPGPEVELTLTQNGVPSNTVTVAIQ